MKNKIDTSRKSTPWDNKEDQSVMEKFISQKYKKNYEEKHDNPSVISEIELLNSLEVSYCKHCKSLNIVKRGKTENGVQRYKCKDCNQTFTILTNTIFMDHKISITEWIEFCLDVMNYGSINLISKVNKNAINTSIYWLNKLFLLLRNYLDNIVLKNTVWLDETFYKVLNSDIDRKKDAKEYRGLSHNQYCIGIACDNTYVYAKFEGMGKTSKVKTLDTFENHIEKGATIVHDKEKSHNILVTTLNLNSESYKSLDLKKMADKENPLYKINEQCDLLKKFLNSHPGFNRENLQDYLNLFCFMQNKPKQKLNKVKILLELAIKTDITLKYRDLFKKN